MTTCDDIQSWLAPLWRDRFRFVALDVETASRNSASICQIGLGCAREDGTVLTWSCYVNPKMEFAPFNIELHGIGPDTVAAAPTFPALWVHLAPFLARHALVQHSRFDEKALDAACRHYGLRPPGWYWVDSVKVARKAWPELKGNGGHGLGNLKEVLGLDFKHHDAGEDARAAAQVVLRARDHLGVPLSELVPPPRPVQLAFGF
ncbi:exonuclease domain-containing protein [Cognatishimia sp. SS12]|uniref:exonuclease domain-containing protein n=1 Tax=Cognatishimia sp. SS12 TaxID=2979465 RepID=UPI00232BCDAE|nr:exonuclease domain-containing protein [Cognatishimia sp. SS12]MDC0738040.1 exonuclease domain-containing protein [Cognatishimia sp. SS12]